MYEMSLLGFKALLALVLILTLPDENLGCVCLIFYLDVGLSASTVWYSSPGGLAQMLS